MKLAGDTMVQRHGTSPTPPSSSQIELSDCSTQFARKIGKLTHSLSAGRKYRYCVTLIEVMPCPVIPL